MSASIETINPNWLHEYLDGAVRTDICTKIHCTTCGAEQFRLGLLRQIQMRTGIRTAGRLTAESALAVGEALAGLQADFSNPTKAEEAIRCILYDAWCVLSDELFQREFVALLKTAWAGAILREMQEHYERLQVARQRQAEYESSAAVAARREKRQRLKREKHAERLARKTERDRLWRQGQPNPGAG